MLGALRGWWPLRTPEFAVRLQVTSACCRSGGSLLTTPASGGQTPPQGGSPWGHTEKAVRSHGKGSGRVSTRGSTKCSETHTGLGRAWPSGPPAPAPSPPRP